MIKLTDDGYNEFLTKWNSCVKTANRIDDKSQANHVVERAYSDLRDVNVKAHKEVMAMEHVKRDKATLQRIKNLNPDDVLKKSIKIGGLAIKLEPSITIDGKQYSFTVSIEWLDFC